MEHKRLEERSNLMEFQQIDDLDAGTILGYLGDISRDGLRMLRKQTIPVGKTFNLRLRCVLRGGIVETVEFEAETMWQREAGSMPFGEIGFRLLDPTEEALSVIDKIVDDIKGRG